MITTDTNKVIYVSDGTTTEYDFSFTVYDSSSVKVYVTDLDNNVSQLSQTDYVVTLNSDYTGKITLTNPQPANYKIAIVREVDLTQETHYIEGDPFPAQSHERALDKLTMISQQLKEEVSRALIWSIFDETTVDTDSFYNTLYFCKVNFDTYQNVKNNYDNINTVSEDITNVNTTSTNIDNVNTVGSNIDNVNTVNNNITNVNTVADNIDSVNNVSNNIEALVKRISMTVNTIKDLIAVDTTNLIDKTAVLVLGYHDPNDGGGGIFYWDTQQDKSNHDGGTIIDPTAIFPTDWSDTTQQNTWFSSSNTGNGCWIRQYNDAIYPEWFGTKGDGTSDDTIAIQKMFNLAINVKKVILTKIYGISSTITADIDGLKVFGKSESDTIVKPLSNFSDTYLFDFGNTTTSRYSVEIQNICFNGNNVNGITGIRWRRINNNSKIRNCRFLNLDIGIEFDELSISNIIEANRFFNNNINIKFIGSSGNGNSILGNYFNGGQVYLNDAMTDVKILWNVFDASASIISDGTSGPRGVYVKNNKFEASDDTVLINLGIVRNFIIKNNIFQGNNLANKAIVFNSTSSVQSAIVAENYFEGFITNYIYSLLPSDTLTIYNNKHDDSATEPYFINEAPFFVDSIAEIKSKIKFKTNEITIGKNNKIIKKFYLVPLTSGSLTDIFSIDTTSGEKGSYACIIEGMISFVPTSTAVAARSFKASFTHINNSDGTALNGDVNTIFINASVANSSTNRDITGITFAVNTASDTESTFQIKADTVGVGTPYAVLEVTLIWDTYVDSPVLN